VNNSSKSNGVDQSLSCRILNNLEIIWLRPSPWQTSNMMKGVIDESQGHVENMREGIRAGHIYQVSSFNHDDIHGGNFSYLGFLFSDALVLFSFSRFICIAFSQELFRAMFT